MRFRAFPRPKYLRTKNKVIPTEARKPILEFEKSIEIVKRKHPKKSTKKVNIENNEFGATK